MVMWVCFGVLCECCVAMGEISREDEEECDKGVWFGNCVADGADRVGMCGGWLGRSVDEVGVVFEVIAERVVFDFDEVRVHLGMTSRGGECALKGGGFSGTCGCGMRDGWVMRWGGRVGGRAVDVGDD